MSGVLLLNATYEALRVVPLKRAVVLVLQEKADVIETAEGEIRSANFSMPRPEVIRLRYFVKIPYKSRVPLSNRAVLNRDNWTCSYCGKKLSKKNGTVDHVRPKALKGDHDWTNVVAACTKCNSKKADKTLQDLGWKLSFKPEAPMAESWIVVANPEDAEAWAQWLEHS